MVLSPQSPLHTFTADRAREFLGRLFAGAFHVRMRAPINLGHATEPEPDVGVVAGAREDFGQAHPTSAVLIVEISDSTLAYDRRRKGSLYARAGVADYWIVNLVQRQLEVYRAPHRRRPPALRLSLLGAHRPDTARDHHPAGSSPGRRRRRRPPRLMRRRSRRRATAGLGVSFSRRPQS
jgi:Uma2 family endonuclease